ncbi:hypothetical protein LEMLEM_LOCUS8586, partial [Lemmus lemmus]
MRWPPNRGTHLLPNQFHLLNRKISVLISVSSLQVSPVSTVCRLLNWCPPAFFFFFFLPFLITLG